GLLGSEQGNERAHGIDDQLAFARLLAVLLDLPGLGVVEVHQTQLGDGELLLPRVVPLCTASDPLGHVLAIAVVGFLAGEWAEVNGLAVDDDARLAAGVSAGGIGGRRGAFTAWHPFAPV